MFFTLRWKGRRNYTNGFSGIFRGFQIGRRTKLTFVLYEMLWPSSLRRHRASVKSASQKSEVVNMRRRLVTLSASTNRKNMGQGTARRQQRPAVFSTVIRNTLLIVIFILGRVFLLTSQEESGARLQQRNFDEYRYFSVYRKKMDAHPKQISFRKHYVKNLNSTSRTASTGIPFFLLLSAAAASFKTIISG